MVELVLFRADVQHRLHGPTVVAGTTLCRGRRCLHYLVHIMDRAETLAQRRTLRALLVLEEGCLAIVLPLGLRLGYPLPHPVVRGCIGFG